MAYIFSGLITGIFSGLVGLGGGALIIPILIYFFGFSQHMAQGISLTMMIPPIGLLAAWTYYKSGYVDIRVAVLLMIGFFLGGFLGAKCAVALPTPILQKMLGGSLIVIGGKMVFF